jgi:phosphoglycerate dehydrogenase-like enzyme
MNLLIFLTHPEPTRSGYEKYLRPRHPELNITTVGTRDEALKLAPTADILMAFGPQVRKDYDSRNIVNAHVLAAMKPSAFLINLARGGLLDEAALVAALNEKRLAGAALDALATEPLPTSNPLWSMPNVIITPHIGGYYDNYPRDAAMQFEQNLEHFQAGRPDLMQHREKR